MPDVHLLDFNAGEPNRGTASLARLLGGEVRVWDVRRDGALPADDPTPWVLGGGPGSPLEEGPWRRPLFAALRNRVDADRPTLAICYGFELLALAAGARLDLLPHPRLGLAPLALTDAGRADPLLRGLDGAGSLENRRWGVWDCPGAALAEGPAGDVAAARLGPRVVGVIFHPEADAEGVLGALAGELARAVDALHGAGAAAAMRRACADPDAGPERVYRRVVPAWRASLA